MIKQEPHNMNYFEALDLPLSLTVDKALVRRRFLEKSRQHHPDYFVNAGADAQQDSLDTSALLNKALQTFSSPDDTIGYVLKLKGILEEEEKYTLDPLFLMEMMEINEALADAEDGGAQVRLQLAELDRELYEPVREIVEGYREGVTTEAELLQVKDYYFKKKYLKRLGQQLGGKL
jgi:molecular chaperone HscB